MRWKAVRIGIWRGLESVGRVWESLDEERRKNPSFCHETKAGRVVMTENGWGGNFYQLLEE